MTISREEVNHFSGIFQVKTDERGLIDTTLKIPERRHAQYGLWWLLGKVYVEP